jgi:hypothetical protein
LCFKELFRFGFVWWRGHSQHNTPAISTEGFRQLAASTANQSIISQTNEWIGVDEVIGLNNLNNGMADFSAASDGRPVV